jgi:glycosyltransferase involved in cell wall biosynthesis
MSRPPPRVSIGLPVFNGEDYLADAIESILRQDFQDFELIISDNASDDATPAICRRFAQSDPRVQYHRSDVNRGAAWNYNRVFELSQGEFFRWQAHDDLCLPGLLSHCLQVFDDSPSSVVVAYPKSQVIDANGHRLPQFVPESLDAREAEPHLRLAKVLRSLNMACPVFGLIRSSALRQTRLIDRFIASDYVLLSELAMLGELREVPQVLFLRRIHPRISTYASRTATQLLQWYDPSQRRYGGLLPPMMALGSEFIRSARRLPLAPQDRLRCTLVAARVWYGRELRNLAGRYKARVLRAMTPAKA